jgi:Family of unknown function (DUF6230)
MTMAFADRPDGHTRWGRFAIAFILPMIAVAVIAGSLLSGVLAATLSVGGIPIQLKVPQLQGQSLGAFGNAAPLVEGDKQVATAGIGNATITGGLCAAIEVPVPVLGGFTIMLNSPQDKQITAKSMVLDITQLKGDLEASNIVIGRDASALSQGGLKGPAGSNGIQSEVVTLSNVEGTAYSLSAGSLKVQGISIDVAGKGAGC